MSDSYEDKRLKTPGYEYAQKLFKGYMERLEQVIKPQKEKWHVGLIGGIYTGWLDENLVLANTTNFNRDMIKSFFCFRILQLNGDDRKVRDKEKKQLPISIYENYFNLEKKPKGYQMDLQFLLECEKQPGKLLWRMRQVVYQTFMAFLEVKTTTEEEGEEGDPKRKRNAYVEFIIAVLLYDLFVQDELDELPILLENMQDDIRDCRDNGDDTIIMQWEYDGEAKGVLIPLGGAIFAEEVKEKTEELSIHWITLLAMRTMIQMAEHIGRLEIDTEKMKRIASPEDEKKRNRFDDDVDGLLSEKIFDGWKIGILSQGEMSSKARGLFINSRKKRLAKELYGEKYKTFAKVCEQYVDWMKQWLEKTEEERDEDDKRYLLDDEWHEEEIVASLTFDDGEGELLPKGRAPLDLFFDALVEVCAEG